MIAEISIRLNRKLRWDPKSETFSDDAEANGFLSTPMRTPWKLTRVEVFPACRGVRQASTTERSRLLYPRHALLHRLCGV